MYHPIPTSVSCVWSIFFCGMHFFPSPGDTRTNKVQNCSSSDTTYFHCPVLLVWARVPCLSTTYVDHVVELENGWKRHQGCGEPQIMICSRPQTTGTCTNWIRQRFCFSPVGFISEVFLKRSHWIEWKTPKVCIPPFFEKKSCVTHQTSLRKKGAQTWFPPVDIHAPMQVLQGSPCREKNWCRFFLNQFYSQEINSF